MVLPTIDLPSSDLRRILIRLRTVFLRPPARKRLGVRGGDGGGAGGAGSVSAHAGAAVLLVVFHLLFKTTSHCFLCACSVRLLNNSPETV